MHRYKAKYEFKNVCNTCNILFSKLSGVVVMSQTNCGMDESCCGCGRSEFGMGVA